MHKPQFMIDNPNWMNTPDLGEWVHVRMPGGDVHPTTNGIHLERFLLEGGQVVEAHKEEVPAEEKPAAPALKGVRDVKIIPHPEKEA